MIYIENGIYFKIIYHFSRNTFIVTNIINTIIINYISVFNLYLRFQEEILPFPFYVFSFTKLY